MDEQDIEKLLTKFDSLSVETLKISQDDFSLEFNKAKTKNESKDIETTVAASVETKKEINVDSNSDVIKSPLVGVLYLSPSPDEKPFKKIGDHVKKGEVVCVVEAMKMFNEVKSDTSGVIEDVLVDDCTMVEFDQPIFKISKGDSNDN
ncbi:acetyl-CoA carboxylase biotin carboxyl carrier protein [Companilactobacillus nuruki]|uniref:Biotin carboxyl carrier protein of acetyl-CoA carboxylase n=1 Tax=Companilactobacillus nuruki TaxID=1993540 RepID=A0A2N7AWA4_9LACO|nr:biotin/lipoyl-containing protein [Companilactobacillus nuruki]PMD73033.1 acetyl-CoA carboxylase biotin carboxyl carrier protein subunit [Companilactobacillus nuruki]